MTLIVNDVLNIDLRTIVLVDVAEGLSHICRFGGRCPGHYCPALDERVLTDDLRWVAAGDLKEGDGLVGFDEYPHELGGSGVKRRRIRPSRVLVATRVKRRIVRLVMDDGSSIRSSAEHPWLITSKSNGNQAWKTAEELAVALEEGRQRYMHRFIEPWREWNSREAGWLAGMFDGEGHLSIFGRKGIDMAVAQNPGLVLDEILRLFREEGFKHSTFANSSSSNVQTVNVNDGWRGMMRVLGRVRPMRLLNTFKEALWDTRFNKQFQGRGSPLQIVAAHHEGEEWVAALETTTKTFICEGFAAHNSVAQHAHLVSMLCEEECQRRGYDELVVIVTALQGLHHDDAEYVVGDVISPVKRHLHYMNQHGNLMPWEEMEARVLTQVLEALEIPLGDDLVDPEIVKYADDHALCIEWQSMGRNTALLGSRRVHEELRPYRTRMPDDAAKLWLERHHKLMAKYNIVAEFEEEEL